MSVACAAKVCERFLWEGDTSNKPFEWTGHHHPSAPPTQAPCLPLNGSVSRSLRAEEIDGINMGLVE